MRTGVNELDVIKKDAAAFKAALRLTREQQDDKQALEDEIKFAKKELEEAGEDADKKKSSAAQLAAKQKELDEMVAGFEVRPAHTCAGRASPPRMRHPHAPHTRRSRCRNGTLKPEKQHGLASAPARHPTVVLNTQRSPLLRHGRKPVLASAFVAHICSCWGWQLALALTWLLCRRLRCSRRARVAASAPASAVRSLTSATGATAAAATTEAVAAAAAVTAAETILPSAISGDATATVAAEVVRAARTMAGASAADAAALQTTLRHAPGLGVARTATE